jgi:hypothetical protein
MALDEKRLREFARHHGEVKFVDAQGTAHVFPTGVAKLDATAAGAASFFYRGRWYDRNQFEQIVDDTISLNSSHGG